VLPGGRAADAPTAATERYVARLHEAGGDPVTFVAHHYTRYLGDLSGGIHIGRTAERHYGIDPTTGSSFFHFEEIPDPDAFKVGYRQALDAAPWSPQDQQRFVGEVHRAYELNAALLTTVPRT
jgi:heme oxygenase